MIIPRSNRRGWIERMVARRHSKPLEMACRACSRPLQADRAETIQASLAKLGCSSASVAKYTPICGRCAKKVVEIAADMAGGE